MPAAPLSAAADAKRAREAQELRLAAARAEELRAAALAAAAEAADRTGPGRGNPGQGAAGYPPGRGGAALRNPLARPSGAPATGGGAAPARDIEDRIRHAGLGSLHA